MRRIAYLLASLLLFLSFVGVACGSLVQPSAISELAYIGHGAQQTVAGSLHVLDADGDLYLVDVGSFMGSEGENYPWPASIPVEDIKAVFVTHAHADHVGRLPLLLREGYTGPVYMTQVTFDLVKLSLVSSLPLLDFGEETFYYSKNNRSERKPVYLDGYDFGRYTVKPENREYFTARRPDLSSLNFYLPRAQLEQLAAELYNRLEMQVRILHPNGQSVVGPFSVRFTHSSHMPGSVMINLSVGDFRMLFSGDVGSNSSPLLAANVGVEGPIDVLFLEGTYASDRNMDYRQQREQFRAELGDFVRQGYRVVIPAFVMDRSQQVLYEISEGKRQGVIPQAAPVRSYSPSANAITALYTYYTHNISQYEHYFLPLVGNASFKPSGYSEPATNWGEENPLALRHGEIGVMSSGMAEHAYARQALLDYLEDPMTVFYFVGFQGVGTPGRILTDGAEQLRLDGRVLEVRAEIRRTSSFSGHATPANMLDLFSGKSIGNIFLVHLEAENAPALVSRYRESLGAEVLVPLLLERYVLFRNEAR